VKLEHLKHNYTYLRSLLTEEAFFCPMVKANAYGHGDVEVTRNLIQWGCRHVGVASVEEALKLRQCFTDTNVSILVFSRWDEAAARAAIEFHLIPVVSRLEDLSQLAQVAPPSKPLPVHVKFDTGLHRMGLDPRQLSDIQNVFARSPSLRLEGICTHLSHGEDSAAPNGHTADQLQIFANLARPFESSKVIQHVYNSAGLLTQTSAKARQGARPGIALYGLSTQSARLQPVMNLCTQIDQLHRVPKGDGVSYGWRWIAPRDSWIATVPVGYGDGYHRCLSNKASMLFRGQRVPVVGSVCMDYSLLDLTDAASELPPEVNEEVVVFGRQNEERISVIELAEQADTIAYELVTGLSLRIPRVYE
jgi:alanine racemase